LLRLGGKRRTIPVALRRALRARDGGCRFPGCDNRRFLHAHHLRHWARGGETSLQNLVLLCSRHHRLVHEGGYGLDERLRFSNRQGRRLPAVWPPPRGNSAVLQAQTAQTIGPHTCAHGSGEPINLTNTVDALLCATAPRHTRVEASATEPTRSGRQPVVAAKA